MAFLLYQLVLAFGFFVFFFYTQYVSLCTSFIFLINLLFVIDLAPNLHNLLYDSSASASFLGDWLIRVLNHLFDLFLSDYYAPYN